MKVSLPETNSSHLKMDGWNTSVSFYLAKSLFFTGKYVSFREVWVLLVCGSGGGDMRWCLDGKISNLPNGWKLSGASMTRMAVWMWVGSHRVRSRPGRPVAGDEITRGFFPWFFGQGWWLKVSNYIGGGFKYLFFSPATWGRFPFWPICFKWVESTNYSR